MTTADETMITQQTEIMKKRSIFGYIPSKPMKLPLLLLVQILMPVGISLIFQGISNVIASAIFTVGNLQLATAATTGSDIDAMTQNMNAFMDAFQKSPILYVCMAVAYVAMIGVYLLIVRFIEKKSAGTIGLSLSSGADWKRAAFAYLRGLGIGVAMMTAVFALLLATGNASVIGYGVTPEQVGVFIAMLVMWFPQGATEEIMTRGYMMSRISPRLGRAGAVAVSSALFALMHMGNNGVNVIAIINLVAVAVFFALMSLLTKELWTVCAIHTIWNLAQGNIFGFWVSGNAPAASILSTAYPTGANELITGGAFGPEGGLIVTFIVGLSIAVVAFLLVRRRNSNAGIYESVES